MTVLGISAGGHDSAAALIRDGRPVAAAQEERFTRRKHDGAFPTRATAFCLEQAGLRPDGLRRIAFHGDIPSLLPAGLDPARAIAIARPLSHAAAAFFPSPHAEAAILVLDETTLAAMGSGSRIHMLDGLGGNHSLGALYSAITAYIGFRPRSGEYKVMGLAPYGEARHAGVILDRLVAVDEDGGFRLDPLCLSGPEALAELFGQPARRPDADPLTGFHMDMAASVQVVTEQVVLRLARSLKHQTGARHLCLGGALALNCVANGKLQREGIFERLWIQPAAGEAGGALGAALAAWHGVECAPRQLAGDGRDAMQGGFLGPDWPQAEIERRLTGAGARFTVLDDVSLVQQTAAALDQGKAVGWVQGRMEFGPRALGARSILADPRSPAMQKVLNLKVKYRESFRPFAPSVLREDAGQWFELEGDSPYMLLVAPVAAGIRRAMTAEEQALFGIDRLNVPRSAIPAATHVDYSARVQTVEAATNPRFHALLSAFKARTGCPVLVNTSFNVRGEPMVCTPEDAFRCFMGTGIEVLAVGNCLLLKEHQDPRLGLDYRTAFAPD